MEIEARTYRMYGLTMYNLSPIQQGIQFAHAIVEYAEEHFAELDYRQWASTDKTVVLLNGGTSNSGRGPIQEGVGSMEQHYQTLFENKIPCEPFYEPDLNDSLSAIAFLADDRVFDRKTYPTFLDEVFKNPKKYDMTKYVLAGDDKEFEEVFPDEYKEWIETVGGAKNAFLKQFITDFRLA